MTTTKEKPVKLVLSRVAVTINFDEGQYAVTSGSRAGLLHTINVEHGTCSCEQYTYRHTCGHIKMADEKAAKDAALLGRYPAWELRHQDEEVPAPAPVAPADTPTPAAENLAGPLYAAFGMEGWS